jgi:hypothetical protein
VPRWAWAALGVLVLAAGCTSRVGVAPGALGEVGALPTMVLATGVEGRDCRTAVLRVPEASLAEAVSRALATVPEASVLTEPRIETRALTTGIYNRRCVQVRGSAARLVRQVVLPGGPGHEGHH